MPQSHYHVETHPVKAMQENFREIEKGVAISWQLRGLRDCYGVYVADIGFTSSSSARKSSCVALTGQIYVKV